MFLVFVRFSLLVEGIVLQEFFQFPQFVSHAREWVALIKDGCTFGDSSFLRPDLCLVDPGTPFRGSQYKELP